MAPAGVLARVRAGVLLRHRVETRPARPAIMRLNPAGHLARQAHQMQRVARNHPAEEGVVLLHLVAPGAERAAVVARHLAAARPVEIRPEPP